MDCCFMSPLVAVVGVIEGQGGGGQGGGGQGLPGLCTLTVLVQQLQCRRYLHTGSIVSTQDVPFG